MKFGDLILWWLPDMEKNNEIPPLGLVMEVDEDAILVQWVDSGEKDFVHPTNCYEPGEFYV